jgi:hypothetical protein
LKMAMNGSGQQRRVGPTCNSSAHPPNTSGHALTSRSDHEQTRPLSPSLGLRYSFMQNTSNVIFQRGRMRVTGARMKPRARARFATWLFDQIAKGALKHIEPRTSRALPDPFGSVREQRTPCARARDPQTTVRHYQMTVGAVDEARPLQPDRILPRPTGSWRRRSG